MIALSSSFGCFFIVLLLLLINAVAHVLLLWKEDDSVVLSVLVDASMNGQVRDGSVEDNTVAL